MLHKHKEAAALNAALQHIPCKWCATGGAIATPDFYHTSCARKMVEANIDEYRPLLLCAQKRLRQLYTRLGVLQPRTQTYDRQLQHQQALQTIDALRRLGDRCMRTHKHKRGVPT